MGTDMHVRACQEACAVVVTVNSTVVLMEYGDLRAKIFIAGICDDSNMRSLFTCIMHAYECMHTHACMHAPCVHKHACTHAYTCTHGRIHAFMQFVHANTHACTRICAHMCTWIRACTRAIITGSVALCVSVCVPAQFLSEVSRILHWESATRYAFVSHYLVEAYF